MESLFNPYKVMWVMCFFDLPTLTKEQRRNHTKFRKNLEKNGFTRFQLSIYARHCLTKDKAQILFERVKKFLPEEGKVGLMYITDKQFGDIEIFNGRLEVDSGPPPQQLELF